MEAMAAEPPFLMTVVRWITRIMPRLKVIELMGSVQTSKPPTNAPTSVPIKRSIPTLTEFSIEFCMVMTAAILAKKGMESFQIRHIAMQTKTASAVFKVRIPGNTWINCGIGILLSYEIEFFIILA